MSAITVGPPPTLSTPRLTLRALTDRDIDDVFAYASDPEVSRFLSWTAHRTMAGSGAFIRWATDRYAAGQPAPWGVCLDGHVIGTATFLSVQATHRFADIGYVLGREHWGRGFAPEVARALIDYGFATLALNRIEAQVRVENVRSGRVLQKAGMRQEALLRQRFFIDGAFHDSRLYAILKDEWADSR